MYFIAPEPIRLRPSGFLRLRVTEVHPCTSVTHEFANANSLLIKLLPSMAALIIAPLLKKTFFIDGLYTIPRSGGQ
ncbi:hypothetical protein [Treponema sp.]|uniref:hypothetical protein n=1 Tax=Treponema sp. TaxID=166 RepID=UPI003FA25EFB